MICGKYFTESCLLICGCQEAICAPSAILDGTGLADIAMTVRAMLSCRVYIRQSSV